MSPSYETIEEYQRLVKMLLTQIFLLSNMKYESIKFKVIIWKGKNRPF